MALRSCRWDALVLLLALACGGTTPAAVPRETSTGPAKAAEGEDQRKVEREIQRQVERQVEREEGYLKQRYPELPPLKTLPRFVSPAALTRKLPENWPPMREQIRNQLAGNEPAEPVLRGGYLDSRERFFLVWILGNFEEVALIFDQRGRETHRQFFSPGKPTFRDVVALETAAERERGVTARELVVFRSTKLSLCCQPIDLEVYALEPSGKLREVLTVPKEHVDVGPGIQYAFLNHVELEAGRGVVTQLVPESSLRWQFEYRSESGRFEPDAATIQSMAAERERWHNH